MFEKEKGDLLGWVASTNETISKWDASVKADRQAQDKVRFELVAIKKQYVDRLAAIGIKIEEKEEKEKEAKE